MAFPGSIYAPPGVYTQTLFENPVQGVLAGVRIPTFIGEGNEVLTQLNLELVRGSAAAVDQFVPQEDETGRAVVSISTTGQVTLGDFNGERRRIQVRNFPIVSGDGSGTTATDASNIQVTINGRQDVVLSVAQADIGIIEISTAPQFGDDVRVSYFFNRTDTQITDDVSAQVTPISAVIEGAKGQPVAGYEFTTDSNVLDVIVDEDTTLSVNFGTGFKSATTVVSLINGASGGAGTSLVASEFTNNFGLVAVRLTADRDLQILNGSANTVLGFTQNQATNRNKVFYVFNGPIVDGTNGGVTTTDPSNVEVRVDDVLVTATAVDGANRAVTLPFAPEVGATVTIEYYFNTWQDTFDYLANIGVTSVTRCGIVPNNADFVEGADFILKDDRIFWGTAFLVSSGVHTEGTTLFDDTQITGLLIDNRWFLAPATAFVDTSVNPPSESRTVFVLPRQPTTGNGRDTPLGQTVFRSISNDRVDLPTNQPSLVQAYWGFGLQDAIERGQVEVIEVNGTQITLSEEVPVGAEVYATFWYNILVDQEYTLTVETAGPSGIGSFFVSDNNENPLHTPKFGTKGPALVGITLQFPSGSELTPDVHFEGGTQGPVEETVTVTFQDEDATIAKYSVPGSGPYFTISGASDHARLTIDSSSLAGGTAGIDLSAINGIAGLGFTASLLGEEIQYTTTSGLTTYDILEGINDDVSFTVDEQVITVTVPAQTAVTADAYVEAINAEAKLAANAPSYASATRFLGNFTVTASEYDTLVFNYTGVTNGATGPVQITIPPGNYVSPNLLATAIDGAIATAVSALPAQFDGLDLSVTANANGQMVFTLVASDTDLGTFATGTVTSAGAILGDTITIDGVTLTGALQQVSGSQDFDTGQARATIIPTGVLPGDTFTITALGGPITITASGSQTPGGLDFNEGVQATGDITVVGPIPGDTVTINGITLTASGSQTPGGLDFDEGTRSSGTATLTGVQYGDTITIDTSIVGGGPVTLTAANTQTPGGLDFNVGDAAQATVDLVGVRLGDTVTLNGTVFTASTTQVGGAYDFNAGTPSSTTLTVVVDALPSTGVLYGDQIAIGGITLTASNLQTPGGLNFDAGTQSTAELTVTAAPSTATVTIDALPLVPAGGPRTPGADDYDETLGSTAAIAADIVAAINDPLNSFATRMTAALGPGANQVTLTWIVPGVLSNGVTIVPSDGTITTTGNFGSVVVGVGDENTTATSIAAAINDTLNGLTNLVSATPAANVVTVTAVTPGIAGDGITTVSNAPARLTFVGGNLTGGAGTDDTAATSLAAAANDALNVPTPTQMTAVAVTNQVTLTAATPGAAGNLLTLATSAPGRFVLSGGLFTGGSGDDISAATSLVAAIADVGNGLVGGVVSDNVGGTSNVVTIESFTPGLVGDGILTSESTGGARIALSAANLLGGVGDNTTVAASLAAAVNDAGNGIVTSVTAIAALNVVDLTAVVPGNNGNLIGLLSSNGTRLQTSALTLQGGSGTDLTVANSIVAAINDAGNGLAVDVSADNDGGTSTTVTVWADVPGIGGNAYALASSDAVRLAISGALFAGGATVVQVASSIVAAINDLNNGLDGIVTADNSSGTSAVVDITAAVPGPNGNFITLASSDIVRLPVSGATLTGGLGLGGGYLEFLDAPTSAQDFAIVAGMSTAALPGQNQTKIINGDIVRRFTAVGASGRLIYDRLILRNRIVPGSGSITSDSQVAQTALQVQGSNSITETGLLPLSQGFAGETATVRSSTLFGEVGFSDGQIASGTFGDARDGQPFVKFIAEGNPDPQNNVFKINIDGFPLTVVFTDATGAPIPAGQTADVPLGPVGTPFTVLNQIRTAATAVGLPSDTIFQEGAGIRVTSSLFDTNSAITIGDGNATTRLGFSSGGTASRTSVQPEVLASALMSHHAATLSDIYLDYQNPASSWFAAQALAGVERDSTAAEFLYLQSQANNIVGLGPSSNITLQTPSAGNGSWLLPGTRILAQSGDGASGEAGISGFFVTSSDPIDGSGSANTSKLNSGVGQDGLIGQTYTDTVTGLTFTVLAAEGGGTYPTGPGAFFTFEVRKLVITDANIPINTIPGLELTVANTTGVGVGDTAIVETFERGGQEPAVGDSYFITYNYSKTDSDFNTALFTSLRAVEANYGPINPDNPVSLAAFLAFINGAVLLAIKQVPKQTGSNRASVQSYIDGLNSLRGFLPGGVLLDTITVMRGDSTELFFALKDHCDIQSSIRFRAERTGIIGLASGTQPSDAGDLAEALKATRIRMVYPDIVTLTITDALGIQKQFLVDGTFLAAAVAGGRASPNVDVATPWTRGPVVGFDQLQRQLDAVQQNQVAVRGVTILEDRNPIIRIRQGFTTDNSNILTKLPTVITIADFVQRSARLTLDRFIGIKFLPGVLQEIEGTLAQTMKALKQAEIIAAYTGVSANTTDDPTVVEVEAFYQPVFPLLYIVITFNLRSQL